MKITKLLAISAIAALTCNLVAADKDKKFKIAENIEDFRAAQTFAVNYTLSQETVKAQFAKGNPEGTRSYNMVVDLAVAYYLPQE